MSEVAKIGKRMFIEFYELTGESHTACCEFDSLLDSEYKAINDYAESLGAECGATKDFKLIGFAFDENKINREEMKKDWKNPVLLEESGLLRYEPKSSSKVGKKIIDNMKKLPKMKVIKDVLDDIAPHIKDILILDGPRYTPYRAEFSFVSKPKRRYFVTVPRYLDDTVVLPDDWIYLTERQYLEIFKSHYELEEWESGFKRI